MTSITETRADDPGLLTRIREKFTRSFEYVGELTDLAIQTMQQMRRGPIERPLLVVTRGISASWQRRARHASVARWRG